MLGKSAKRNLVIFRVDSSYHIGSGHVMRCLTLADALTKQGVVCHFVSRDGEGSLHQLISERGYPLALLPPPKIPRTDVKSSLMHGDFLTVSPQQDIQDFCSTGYIEQAAAVIVDHYGIDEDWQRLLPLNADQSLVVIDDLADRIHLADILIDQNYYLNQNTRYTGKILPKTRTLLGPEYAIIRPQFADLKLGERALAEKAASNFRILVSFGGVDIHGYGLNIVKTLLDSSLRPRIECTLIGKYNRPQYQQQLDDLAYMHKEKICYLGYTNEPWKVMAAHSIYIGAGGTTTWERCCIGIPGIIFACSENQIQMSKDLAAYGCQFYLNRITEFSAMNLLETLKHTMENERVYTEMSRKSSQLVDGLGARRVAKEIVNAG